MELSGRVFAIRFGDKAFRLWDLPLVELDEIAKRNELTWLDLLTSPLQSPAAAKDMVDAAAKKLGVEVPLLESARDFWTIFELAEDDLPGSYHDGIPKGEAADQETIGSS